MAAQRARDYLQPALGGLRLGELSENDIRLYRLAIERRGVAPRTVHHLLTDLRCLLRWAVRGRLLPESPFDPDVMPRIQKRRPDRLTDPEVLRLGQISDPQRFVCWLFLGTGMRWAEGCRARREDVEGGMLHLSATKNRQVRSIPLDPDLMAAILRRPGRLVPYGEGSAGSFNKLVRKLSGVGRFHVHQLRHTFACRWIERGGSLPALQQILGHESIVTTQMYARASDDMLRREHARVSGTNGWSLQS